MVIEDDETEDDDASFWQQSHQKPSLREKSAWTRCSTHKAKVRKGEVKEELLQVKEEVLEVEQPDSPVDSEAVLPTRQVARDTRQTTRDSATK